LPFIASGLGLIMPWLGVGLIMSWLGVGVIIAWLGVGVIAPSDGIVLAAPPVELHAAVSAPLSTSTATAAVVRTA
jgi:hypothetical protein